MCYNGGMTENSTHTTWLNEYGLIDLKVRHAALVKKAAKLGVPAPAYHLTGEERERTVDELWGTKVTEYEVAYETFPVRYEGWKFVALVDHTVGIVTAAPGAPEGIVAEYIDTKPTCDACGHARHRTYTVVVEDEEGKRLRVGGTCVKDYIGNLSIKPWLSYEREVREAYETTGGGLPDTLVPTIVVVAIAHRVAMTNGGYVSASAEFGAPTKGVVHAVLFPSSDERPEDRAWRLSMNPTEDDYEYAAKAIEYVKGLAGHSDFEKNLKAVVAKDYFDAAGRGFGILVYAAEAFRRAEVKRVEAEAKAKAEISKSPAPVGRCIVTGTIAGVYEKDNPYCRYGGTITKIRVIADAGYGVYLTLPSAISHADKGDRVEFTATLEPSHDDRFFAFGSRPSKARILEPAA